MFGAPIIRPAKENGNYFFINLPIPTSFLQYLTNKKMTVKERTESIIKNHFGKISKKEIADMCPDINKGSIERALRELLYEDKILKITGGRYTKYIYNNR